MQVDSVSTQSLPSSIAEKIGQFKDEAHAKRKKRKLPASYITFDALRGIHFLSRGERISPMFGTCALDPESRYNLALFGPQGSLNSCIYDVANHDWKGQLSDEQGDVLDVDWYNRGPVTAGSDGTVSIWSTEGVVRYKFQAHQGPVVGVDLHPMGGLLGSTSRDGEWALHDLVNETTVARFKDDAGDTLLELADDSILLFGYPSRWTRLCNGL
jgi:WD40 repeat protein